MSGDETPTANKSAEVIMLGRCPMCRKRATLDYRPFCSKRCSDLDLSRWMGGVYSIPVEDVDGTEADVVDLLPDE
jgi:endogenous inhibitor of DNA gyrase (YacG/DUF329 family)